MHEARERLEVVNSIAKVLVDHRRIHLEVAVHEDISEAGHPLDPRGEVGGKDPVRSEGLKDFLVVARTGQATVRQNVQTGVQNAFNRGLKGLTNYRLLLPLANNLLQQPAPIRLQLLDVLLQV